MLSKTCEKHDCIEIIILNHIANKCYLTIISKKWEEIIKVTINEKLYTD